MHLIDVNKAAKYLSKHIFMITDKFAVGGNCILRASEEQLFKLRCKLEVPEICKWYRREKNETVEVENYNGNNLLVLYRDVISDALYEMENTRLNDGLYQYFSVKGQFEYYPIELDLLPVPIAPRTVDLDGKKQFLIIDGVHIFRVKRCLLEPNGYLKETDLFEDDSELYEAAVEELENE